MIKQLDDDMIPTKRGDVPYSVAERICIMLESGATLAEARAQAAREEQWRAVNWVPGSADRGNER